MRTDCVGVGADDGHMKQCLEIERTCDEMVMVFLTSVVIYHYCWCCCWCCCCCCCCRDSPKDSRGEECQREKQDVH